MPYLQYFGLLIALTAAPLLLALFKWLGSDPLSPGPRFSLWVAGAVVLAIATTSENWVAYLGLGWPTWSNLALALLAAVAMFLVLGLSQYFQRKLGTSSTKQFEQYKSILRLPFSHRLFLVVTAAVTEEVLYRSYAIGVGQHLLGSAPVSAWLACVLSVVAFTLAHARWGLAHLLPVFVAALIFTLLFTLTHNLWVCIIAHAIVDAVGFLVVPAIMARRLSAPPPNAS